MDPVRVLTGVTASGKKEVGLELARKLGAEVIGLDSVKLYHGLTVGSASASGGELQGVRTHLLGQIDPRQTFSVGQYVDAARAAVEQIESRGKPALFLGGTPLYLQALLRGLFQGPRADPELRARLREEADRLGVETLHARMARIDPQAGKRIHERDFKRISRALEVHELTGTPISELQRSGTRRPIEREFRVVALDCDDALLRRRQQQRVEQMLADGLVEEVRRLRDAGMLVGELARAIGYREILEHLDGKLALDQASEEIVRATRRLTQKQRKWFRRFPEIVWVKRNEEKTVDQLVQEVAVAWSV